MAISKTRTSKTRTVKDPYPKWDDCENWSTDQFLKQFKNSMDYYRLEVNSRELKPQVISWMEQNGYTKNQIKQFKDSKDYRCNSTMGAIAANLLRGMPPVREDFNEGRNTALWLGSEINRVIEEGKNDVVVEPEEVNTGIPQPSIQDRLRESAYRMTEELEDALEEFHKDQDAFNPKQFKVLNLLKGKQAKAAHARVIRDLYYPQLTEYEEAKTGRCEQLKEGYGHISKKNLQKLIDFHQEIISACDMLMQEAKVNKKPRAKKSVPAEKIVSKLKYSKTHEPLKLVSINPTDILGAKELWIFNTKTRKLGKYVAAEYQELGVKGTSVTGFDENKSVQKTLRKPEDQLKEFKSVGKVGLRKFLEDIKAVDIKLNGRINEDTILLKVS